MVIYSEEYRGGFEQYGILIPVRDSKFRRTFAELKTHPVLGPRQQEWHLEQSGQPITREDLLRAHSEGYVNRLFSDGLEAEIIRTYELVDREGRYYRYDPGRATRPLRGLLERALYNISGVYQCCRVALERGFCFYFGGGAHHAQPDFGKGFCLLNDIVIALRKAQAEGSIRNAWVIDVDAHKGDGTAVITREDPSIRTLSVHMARGWPLDEPELDDSGRRNPSFTPSDVDVPVESGQEREYVPRLEQGLKTLAGLSSPDLALVVSGADPYEHDELPSTGLLRLSKAQMMERDTLIYSFLKHRGIPSAYLMSGGYGEKTWEIYHQFVEWALLDRLSASDG
ncbi:MAG: histone deacetylase [Spirochaetales bacterium]|nr:histone deacetylase [Spirochaetales bacterium]